MVGARMAVADSKRRVALLTGVTGQDGAYLAEYLLGLGYTVHGVKRRSSSFNTARVDHLYEDPHARNVPFLLHYGDMTDSTNLIRLMQQIRPTEIYNLAAQSHVGVSFESPEYIFRAFETDADMALGGEVIDLGRPNLLHQPDQVGGIRHVAIMQQERHIAGMRVFIEMIDPRGVERGRPPLDAMHGVAEAKQIFRQIGAVLPGHPGQKRYPPFRIRTRHLHSNDTEPVLLQTEHRSEERRVG